MFGKADDKILVNEVCVYEGNDDRCPAGSRYENRVHKRNIKHIFFKVSA